MGRQSNINAAWDMFDVHKWFHDLTDYYGKPMIAFREYSALESEFKFEISNGSIQPIVEYCPICGKRLGGEPCTASS